MSEQKWPSVGNALVVLRVESMTEASKGTMRRRPLGVEGHEALKVTRRRKPLCVERYHALKVGMVGA